VKKDILKRLDLIERTQASRPRYITFIGFDGSERKMNDSELDRTLNDQAVWMRHALRGSPVSDSLCVVPLTQFSAIIDQLLRQYKAVRDWEIRSHIQHSIRLAELVRDGYVIERDGHNGEYDVFFLFGETMAVTVGENGMLTFANAYCEPFALPNRSTLREIYKKFAECEIE